MWTGAMKAPPLPQEAITQPSPDKSSSTFRPGSRDVELEELRQRGLAKLLNKHFTEACKKLAMEKAAADAALRDLEARKAATSDFQASGNYELSPLDALYLSVHQWRNECRRKERETLLLYQRYVDRFGASGQVMVPNMNSSDHSNQNNNSMIKHSNGSGPADNGGTYHRSLDSPAVSAACAAPPPQTPPTKEQVPHMTASIEEALAEHVRKGGSEMPSLEVLGKDATFQKLFEKEELEFRNYYRRQLEIKGVDIKSPEWTVDKNSFLEECTPETGVASMVEKLNSSNSRLDKTSNNSPEPSHLVRAIHEDLTGTSNDWDRATDDCLGSLYVPPKHDDTDAYSIVSGLTFNSAETRRVLQDCERSVADFLKEEQLAIRKIMEEDSASVNTSKTGSSAIGTVTQQAAAQAESMAKQMQRILDDFKTREGPDPDLAHSLEGRPYKTKNPDEQWMVYFDDTYKREYYHEANTNRTQWDPPGSDDAASVAERSAHLMLTHDDVMPDNGSGVSVGSGSVAGGISRVELYRRKRRRRRKRRMMAAAVLAAFSVIGGVYYMYHQHEIAVAQQQQRQREEALRKQMELQEEERRAIEVARKESEEAALRQAEAERQAKELAVAAAKQAEEERQAQEEAEHRVEQERKARLAAAEAEARRLEQARLAAERAAAAAERAAAEQAAVAVFRPPHCNVPFAYVVNPHCRRLAEDNPWFDLHDLVHSMMQ